jgi:hypothetical protein
MVVDCQLEGGLLSSGIILGSAVAAGSSFSDRGIVDMVSETGSPSSVILAVRPLDRRSSSIASASIFLYLTPPLITHQTPMTQVMSIYQS